MSSFQPIRAEVDRAVASLLAGAAAGDLESRTFDFKEEDGSVGRDRTRTPTGPRGEPAARALAEAAACFANSRGGAILVGVDDKRGGVEALVGASLEAEWLRRRIWDLSTPRLTVEIEERVEQGVRLLVIYIPRGFDLHKVGKRITHRIDTGCVDMPPDVQRRVIEERSGYDWSAEETSATAEDVSASAVERARGYLRASGERSRIALAARDDPELLRQLGVMTASGRLNRAGEILFVAAPHDEPPLVVYRRRRAAGGSSTQRIDARRPLIEAYHDVRAAIDAVNEIVQVPLAGGVRAQIRIVPDDVVREAIVNALIHRDYRLPGPVDIELVGAELVVNSPGGFVSDVNEHNILSHPSEPRNATLTRAFRSLRLAEQEGVGVDRMYRDMIRTGHEPPSIIDTGGRIRCTLLGGVPFEPIVELVGSLPDDAQDDVDVALIVHALLDSPAVRVEELAGMLQRTEGEAHAALRRAESYGVVIPTSATRRYRRPQYRLADPVRERLRTRLAYLTTSAEEAEEHIVRKLAGGGSLTSADVQEMCGVRPVQASRILRTLRESGIISIGSEHETGRGVFYVRGPRYGLVANQHGIEPGPAG